MTERQPLTESDRAVLHSKARRARGAFRACVVLAFALPAILVVFVSLTPTELNTSSVALVLIPCLVLALPLMAKCYDLHRSRRRVAHWLEQGHKKVVTGPVTEVGPHFTITVGEMSFAAWEKSRQLSVGDEVTVEHLPLDSPLAGILGVLSVDGEPNPYFDSAWRTGPPTA